MGDTAPITEANEPIFDEFDIDLEPEDDETLGSAPSRPAVPTHSIGSVNFRRTSVAGTVTRIGYFSVQGAPICLLEFGLRFKSGTEQFRLEKCDIVCRVRNLASSSSGPRFRAMAPTMLFNRDPVSRQFIQSIQVMPQIQVSGVTIGGVGWSSQTSYTREDGWDFDGSITDSDDGLVEQNTATFNAVANGSDRRGFSQYIEAGLFIEHTGQPFAIDFEIAPQLQFLKRMRYLGRSRARQIRTFDPPGQASLLQAAGAS